MEKVGKLNFMKDQSVHTHQHFLSQMSAMRDESDSYYVSINR